LLWPSGVCNSPSARTGWNAAKAHTTAAAQGEQSKSRTDAFGFDRKEQAAKQELQRALRTLILAAEPKDRFTLEVLLRAVEAGEYRSLSYWSTFAFALGQKKASCASI